MKSVTQPTQLGPKILELIAHQLSREDFLAAIAHQLVQEFALDVCLILPKTIYLDSVFQGYCQHRGNFQVVDRYLTIGTIKETTQCLSLSAKQWENVETGLQNIVKQLDCQSILYVSTYAQNQANGWIFFGKYQEHQWSLKLQQRLQETTTLISIAIQQQQLYWQQKKQHQYQNLLFNLTREIEHSSNLPSIWRMTLTGLKSCLNINQGFILKLEYKDFLLVNNYQYHLPNTKVEILCQLLKRKSLDKLFQLRESQLCQKAWLNSPEPLIVNNVNPSALDNFGEKDRHIFQPHIFLSTAVIPMMTKQLVSANQEMVLGLIILQKELSYSWKLEEINFVKTIAIQLAMAIINQQVLAQIQSLVDERTSQLKWSLDMQGKLLNKMLKQLENLKELNTVKDKFIARLSDELKLPLTNMKVSISMLKSIHGESPSNRYLQILESEYKKEESLINDLLTFQQIKLGQLDLHYEPILITSLAEKATKVFQQDWQKKEISLQVDYPSKAGLTIYSDQESLERIIKELLDNAGKFAKVNSEVELSLKLSNDTQKAMVITVTNLGRNISEAEKDHIFTPFYQGKDINSGSGQGTGLGLFFVRSLVEHLNGKIEIDSKPTATAGVFSTVFSVTLPRLSPAIDN